MTISTVVEPPEATTLDPGHNTTLRRVLAAVLRRRNLAGGLQIVQTKFNDYSSTFDSYFLDCRLGDGSSLRVFWKRGGGPRYSTCGHKGGVVYEAEVFRRVLSRSQLSLPRYYGSHRADDGETWLFMESLDDCVRWTTTVDPDANAVRLAGWIGRFHAEQEAAIKRSAMPSLARHDAPYYRNWIQRTWQFAQPLHDQFPWLCGLCQRAHEVLPWLLNAPRTLIHGELFPQNVLIRDQTIFPVDWEAAAIAAGELDLVSMTDNWPEQVAARCEAQYIRSRWSGQPPAEFACTLAVARLFHQFLWLGDHADRTLGFAKWRFSHLRTAGERLGLI